MHCLNSWLPFPFARVFLPGDPTSGSAGSLIHELKELLVQQFIQVTHSGLRDRGGEDKVVECRSITMPAWLSSQYAPGYSISVDGSKLTSAFQCNSPNPVIPNLGALSAGGAEAGAEVAGAGQPSRSSPGAPIPSVVCNEDVVKQAETAFTQMLAKARLEDEFRLNTARASEEWRMLESGEVGAVAEEVQEVLTSTLFPSNRFTRRRPDYSGSSLSSRGLIRYFLTNGSDPRIYQQLNAGERRLYKIALVIDRSASMMGTALLQASAICGTMMALARMGLAQSTCILSFGETVELVKPYNHPFDDAMILSLLSTVRSAESLASMDADGISAAAAVLAKHSGFGPSFIMVFSGTCFIVATC